ncbi:MAG: helix-turn-helix transcriptional regulator [Dorea sp.]|jgi:transcriptional regulator with XRE-family HTH domain|nr:helix-turn-helix transcriptional regulator [Erysipelotrichaceae bacterium]MCI9075862.1 helix-turn-helix transcriptional regulator [Dorea sp.]
MNEQFVRERITQLRLRKGVSEYQMSYALGHSRGYINNITSGKSLPSMNEFFAICEYFGITPAEFFDEHNAYPELQNKMIKGLHHISEDDFKLILQFIKRLQD